jgi:AraC-like DNA-binding protein
MPTCDVFIPPVLNSPAVKVFATALAFDKRVTVHQVLAVDDRRADLDDGQRVLFFPRLTDRQGGVGRVGAEVVRSSGSRPLFAVRRQRDVVRDAQRPIRKVDRLRRCTLSDVARERAMNPRQLNRLLEREGCTYRELLDEARCALALRLMCLTDLSLGQIAPGPRLCQCQRLHTRLQTLEGCLAAGVATPAWANDYDRCKHARFTLD